MLVSAKTRRATRIQNTLFLILFLALVGVLAWLSTRYTFTADWTATGRNTLSTASNELLEQLDDPVNITAFATEDESIRHAIRDLLARYQRHKHDITLTFVNPDLQPARVRELGIQVNGELLIEYQGRQEKLTSVSEQSITNALQRLARSGERWLVFLEGHGERRPLGEANHDLGAWGQRLEEKGFKIQSQNLVATPAIPDNTAVLVLAGPQANLMPGEVALIQQFIEAGGNLLWLADPGDPHGLQPLADTLGVHFVPGVIVDPTTRVLGISDPRLAIVSTYPPHPMTRNFDVITLFPQAVGIKHELPAGWQGQAILVSAERSWSETAELSGQITFDEGRDSPGPLSLGVLMSRARGDAGEQRIVIIGDGDFLSNAYLGNGGNLTLGMNLINWLAHDDRFIDIPVKVAPDRTLTFSPLAQGMIGLGWLVLLPLGLATMGAVIWWRRKR
ncbi:MAG TPA: ABC transporter [Gammaproteobacteria bacterium]|nr:ABC transporter [Gammaproteobacteria bacterium]